MKDMNRDQYIAHLVGYSFDRQCRPSRLMKVINIQEQAYIVYEYFEEVTSIYIYLYFCFIEEVFGFWYLVSHILREQFEKIYNYLYFVIIDIYSLCHKNNTAIQKNEQLSFLI